MRSLLMTADQHLWMSDGHATWKILKYDLTGRMLHSWGTWGPAPAQLVGQPVRAAWST